MELAKFNNLLESKTAKRKVKAGGAGGGGFGKSSLQLGSVSTPDLRYSTTRNSVERRIWSSRRELLRNTHKSWTRHDQWRSKKLFSFRYSCLSKYVGSTTFPHYIALPLYAKTDLSRWSTDKMSQFLLKLWRDLLNSYQCTVLVKKNQTNFVLKGTNNYCFPSKISC